MSIKGQKLKKKKMKFRVRNSFREDFKCQDNAKPSYFPFENGPHVIVSEMGTSNVASLYFPYVSVPGTFELYSRDITPFASNWL